MCDCAGEMKTFKLYSVGFGGNDSQTYRFAALQQVINLEDYFLNGVPLDKIPVTIEETYLSISIRNIPQSDWLDGSDMDMSPNDWSFESNVICSNAYISIDAKDLQ
jgi:hypothetical protein